jgi:hydroxymethylbilane synthase
MSASLSPSVRARPTPVPGRAFRVGTRGSPLALTQARLVISALSAACPGLTCAEQVITTTGDQVQDRPLVDLGGKGLFAKEIDSALLEGRIDFAVHSLKDLETELPRGITLACVLRRADPRDALVLAPRSQPVETAGLFPMLPVGARIGTASARRQAQLLHARPDLRIGLIRGNVQTRLNRLASGDFAATLLALAGLERLGLAKSATTVLAPELMVPAAGQGIIGVTTRADDERAIGLLARINDAAAYAAATAERAVLKALDGSCRTPIGAYARPLPSGDLLLTAMVARTDGSFLLKRWRRGAAVEAASLGAELGISLRADSPADVFT